MKNSRNLFENPEKNKRLIEIHARIMKIMKIQEIHLRVTKIMKIIAINVNITKIMKIIETKEENYENQ